MPPSPRTPRRSQHSYRRSADLTGDPKHTHSRTSSSTSSVQPATSSPIHSTVHSVDGLPAARHRDGDGHGNLADELADALDEEDEREGNFENTTTPFAASPSPSPSYIRLNPIQGSQRSDISHAVEIEYDKASSEDDYDGTSLRVANFSFIDIHVDALQSALKDFETESHEVPGGPFIRLAKSLRDLPTQSAIENGTSRLITTHTALTSHAVNQTRALQSLAHPLISPFAAGPKVDDIDELVSLIKGLVAAVPSQGGQCLSALDILHSLTIDLGQTLTFLSDSIYMMRQNLSSASRKLRTVTDMVGELKREADVREEAIRWIESGQWDRRLLDRRCGHVCGEVIGGFEEVCQGWRQRLLAG